MLADLVGRAESAADAVVRADCIRTAELLAKEDFSQDVDGDLTLRLFAFLASAGERDAAGSVLELSSLASIHRNDSKLAAALRNLRGRYEWRQGDLPAASAHFDLARETLPGDSDSFLRRAIEQNVRIAQTASSGNGVLPPGLPSPGAYGQDELVDARIALEMAASALGPGNYEQAVHSLRIARGKLRGRNRDFEELRSPYLEDVLTLACIQLHVFLAQGNSDAAGKVLQSIEGIRFKLSMQRPVDRFALSLSRITESSGYFAIARKLTVTHLEGAVEALRRTKDAANEDLGTSHFLSTTAFINYAEGCLELGTATALVSVGERYERGRELIKLAKQLSGSFISRARIKGVDWAGMLARAERLSAEAALMDAKFSTQVSVLREGRAISHSSSHVQPRRTGASSTGLLETDMRPAVGSFLGGDGASRGEATRYDHRPLVPVVAVNDIGEFDDILTAVIASVHLSKEGDLVKGVVMKVDREGILVDVGGKSDAFIPWREFAEARRGRLRPRIAVGDQVESLILTKEDDQGRLIASKRRADAERAWAEVTLAKEKNVTVSGAVVKALESGLIVDVGLRGFMPASLVEMRRVSDLAPYIGQHIEAKIIELDKSRNKVVLSRRAWLEHTQSEVRSTILSRLEKGHVRPGVVSSIATFGAFVDLGGVDGLIHVSELSTRHIDHPSEVVEVGQEVTVEVLEVDLDRERVSLSLKATQEDPWQTFARTHALGQVVPGKVTKLVPFGAFVRVEDGIEGLMHISELTVRHVELAEQVVSVGDELFVKVIDIDLERRRISLSLKQANEGIDAESTEFDPALYGMAAEYDEEGNYKYPEGFNPESNEWLEGYENQRAAWEQQYADAQTRWEAHKKQVAQHAADDAAAATSGERDSGPTSYSSELPARSNAGSGVLASNEALRELRRRLEEE